jgi:hypothetical protein
LDGKNFTFLSVIFIQRENHVQAAIDFTGVGDIRRWNKLTQTRAAARAVQRQLGILCAKLRVTLMRLMQRWRQSETTRSL